MAFLDKVTSGVQKLTRRVGGGGHGVTSHSSAIRNGQNEGADDGRSNDETVDATKCNQLSPDMNKRNQKESASSSRYAGRNEESRRRENELNETYRRKLDTARQRWQIEKAKEIDALVANLKKKHDAELQATVKGKEKEMKVLRAQLRKSQQQQQQVLERSRSGILVNAVSQDSLRSTRSQDYSHSRGRTPAELANMRDQLSELNQTIKRNEQETKGREIEIRTMREQHETEIQRMARDAQRHIKALLEELQQKERKIEKLERQLRLNENQLSNIREEQNTSTSAEQGRQSPQVLDMKSAASTSSMASSRLGGLGGPSNTISKDEYDKEKQRWQQRMSEVEAALKKSEETSADLTQGKAEMIRKNRELEKVKKSLEEFNRKLCDRQKILMHESKQLEQKMKEAQEEAIRTTQACETLTLECNRLKEKRYNPDRDEELERLRQQNLEYCKCIAALKQTILEKDRRLEVLQQKLRRTKRTRATIGGIERSDDENTARSVNDLDFSASSMSLDTINEDYGEATKEELEVSYRQLANEHLELQNICSSLMKQINADGTSHGSNQELRNRLHGALQRIVQLERNNVAAGNIELDSAWSQEKTKYTALIRAMGEKIHHLELAQERLQQELTSAKEENELLEFQVLEMEQSQSEVESSTCRTSVMSTSSCSKSQCDRSVSTSEDEGHFSMEHSLDESSVKDLPMEELKIRLTLLKHRKELRPDDRSVIAQVKDLWENLQNEHSLCASKAVEIEMKFRESETLLRAELEALQLEKQELSVKDKKKLKAKELQRELDVVHEQYSTLQEDNACMKKELDDLRVKEADLESLYKSCVESEERERAASIALRKQLDDLAVSRQAEIEILEQASRQQSQNLSAMRTKISDLEKESDQMKEENRSLSSELAEHRRVAQSKFKDEEVERLRRMNVEYQESLTEYKKLETRWTEQKEGVERKYADVKVKFKEAMKLIKEYEQNISKYVERLKEAAREKEEWMKIRILQEQRIADLERELELWNRSGKPSRDDFIACKEVEEQLKTTLREKSNELEEKCVVERQLMDEKQKLQKQLQHVKSYSAQLEKQFEMQIQIVQTLKGQLLELQRVAQEREERLKENRRSSEDASTEMEQLRRHVIAAHSLLSLVVPICKVDSTDSNLFCCHSATSTTQNASLLTYQRPLEEAAVEIWNCITTAQSNIDNDFEFHKVCVKLRSANDALDRLETALQKEKDGERLSQPVEALKKLCSAVLSYNETLSQARTKLDELEKSATLFKEEADKANARTELLQRQYHDAVRLQMDPLKPYTAIEENCASPVQPAESTVTLDTRDANVVRSKLLGTLEDVYRDLKGAIEKTTGENNTEALASLQVRLSHILNAVAEDIGVRTISPLELCGSGTESEQCERSPLLLRKRRSPAGAAGGSFRSSSSDECESKSTRSNAPSDEQEIKDSTNVDDSLSPPTNVRLAANLRNGRYLVCWSPPKDLTDVQGYKVYVKDVLKKQVGSPHCSKVVVECTGEDDWMFINVSASYVRLESAAANIDMEKSKKYIQNATPSDNNDNRRSTSRNHDSNEEYSEV